MEVFGYGEDALTFWAVTKKLDEILRQLKDNTDMNECIVFYRPSFGRRSGEQRSEFGEFDAIIITPKTVYLVESKWDKNGTSFPNNILKLDDVQIRRHKIFRHYYKKWKEKNWSTFAEKYENEFKKIGINIPKKKTVLKQNLLTVLEEAQGRKLVDVLLFLHTKKPPKIQTDFRKVKIKYKPAKGNYITMT